ncbi:MAG TPA: DUF542 domain-containing protein [Gemmatimonadaceae bacterium]|nr:DUF542 domain-containing protein [Gemmatimonadaceae bacterium]
MIANSPALDATLTVDQITARFPETIEVHNRLGIDMCCGGGVTLAAAAARDGAPLSDILSTLGDVIAWNTGSNR